MADAYARMAALRRSANPGGPSWPASAGGDGWIPLLLFGRDLGHALDGDEAAPRALLQTKPLPVRVGAGDGAFTASVGQEDSWRADALALFDLFEALRPGRGGPTATGARDRRFAPRPRRSRSRGNRLAAP